MNHPQLGSFEAIPLSAIRPSTTNPRKYFDEAAMEELTRSIQETGVTTPLLLRHVFVPARDSNSLAPIAYEIVAGERRYRAAKAAGREDVPAIVREIDDQEALDLQMIENLQRADLHPMEEAEGYRVLESHGATPEDIAKRSGKTVQHVVQRMRLLSLELDAKQMFAEGHLTLGHALLLARLTPIQQVDALVYLLGIAQWEIKKDSPATALIQQRLGKRKPVVIAEEDEEDGLSDHLRGMHERAMARRLVDPTEAQLKDWIQSHVLLQLAGVPWHLADATLVPSAGACTDCPKRTGANIALFQDLTTSEDTCTDPVCFSTKQAAQVKRQKDAAKTSGAQLLKISAKTSHDKLEEKAVEVKKGATTVTKATVKQGQWEPSEEGACASSIQALMTDGPNKGKLMWVCPDQACKTHKHQVYNNGPSQRSNPAKEAEVREKRTDTYLCELKVRGALLNEARTGVTPNAALLRECVLGLIDHGAARDAFPVVVVAYGLELPPIEDHNPWNQQIAAGKVLRKKVESMTSIAQLTMVLFDLYMGHLLEPDYWSGTSAQERKRVAGLVAEHGVDQAKVDSIVARVTAEHNAPKLELQAQAAPAAETGGKKKLTAAEQTKRKAAAAKKFPNTPKKAAAKKAGKAGA